MQEPNIFHFRTKPWKTLLISFLLFFNEITRFCVNTFIIQMHRVEIINQPMYEKSNKAVIFQHDVKQWLLLHSVTLTTCPSGSSVILSMRKTMAPLLFFGPFEQTARLKPFTRCTPMTLYWIYAKWIHFILLLIWHLKTWDFIQNCASSHFLHVVLKITFASKKVKPLMLLRLQKQMWFFFVENPQCLNKRTKTAHWTKTFFSILVK